MRLVCCVEETIGVSLVQCREGERGRAKCRSTPFLSSQIQGLTENDVEKLASMNGATRAFFTAAGKVEASRGLTAGTGGAVLSWEGGKATSDPVPGGHDLSAAAVDPFGRSWVAGAGRVWRRRSSSKEKWRLQWEDPSMTTAIISILPDIGLLRAIMADGTVVEGTSPLGR